tara:strand:- start:3483 stop:4502 length:1020 start_codon:yes stop_codon:yes gene_type:complete
MRTITEGKATIKVETPKIVSKQMKVFYNPLMKFNRDMSVLFLSCVSKGKMDISLPLAGSGVRGVRLLKELAKSKIGKVWMNDISPQSVKNIKANLKANNVKAEVEQKNANVFLLEHSCMDYIDIDPFGPPTPFLYSAIEKVKHNGFLAVTATDTSALAGTYPQACQRKYWAEPKRDSNMHETGLRILIRRVQLVGGDAEKGLVPLFSYAKDHYYRVFFQCSRGKKAADHVLSQHAILDGAGPLWTGQLWDAKLAAKMAKKNTVSENQAFLDLLAEESRVDVVGIHHIHAIAKKHKLETLPKQALLIEKILKKKKKVAVSHLDPVALRSTISEKELVRLL